MDWQMKKPKEPCTACGSTPYDESDPHKAPLDMAVALGVDINWGNDLCLCQSCIGHLADLVDRLSQEESAKLTAELDQVTTERDELMETVEMQQKRIDRIIDGARAKKELKESKDKKVKA